ncbi:MAG: tetratricopeptide repeat protein [Rhodobacterales bacterium]|nr:tetratricopeptide repeat protein [Rhodobacterales bacterium]
MPLASCRLLAALALVAVFAGPVRAEEADAGAYLAARVAESHNDFRAASGWYGKALLSDSGDSGLLEGAILAELASGDLGLAKEAAQALKKLGGEPSQIAELVLAADEAQREDYAALLAASAEGRDLGDLVNALVAAWAKVGEGKMSEALAAFDTLSQTKGLEAFGYYHKALALASVGDFEGADDILSGRSSGPIYVMRRGVVAHLQILSQLERNADALALLDRSFGTEPDPIVDELRRRLQAGEPLPFDTVRTARDGIAEAFYSVATALEGEADPVYTLLHLRVAVDLRPDHADAVLLTAKVLETLGQHQLAAETYATFPPEDPNFVSAEIGRAKSLRSQGNADGAIEALQALARGHGNLLQVQFALADMLRLEERFDEAEVAYSAAIDLLPEVSPEHWILFFYRGIAHEQSKDWPPAEVDFRRALDLNPTQPQVLNYLGYGLVDRGEKLDEALGMIEKAVAADPDQGYIIDSLAWALFRLGRYDEALGPMERASLLEPVDPIVTDHLGDVYWKVGRKLEAQFQWRRALSFEPAEKDAERIRRKLDVGLDVVMDNEAGAAEPVKAAGTGD